MHLSKANCLLTISSMVLQTWCEGLFNGDFPNHKWFSLLLFPSDGLVPIHIRGGEWGVKGLTCRYQSSTLLPSPWREFACLLQIPEAFAREAEMAASLLVDCVAEWLQQPAAWLSAGHNPLPEPLTQSLPIHPLFTPPALLLPPRLISHLFLLAKRAVANLSEEHIQMPLFCSPLISPCIHLFRPLQEQSRLSSKELKFLPSPSSRVSLWRDFSQSWPSLGFFHWCGWLLMT